MTTLVGLVLSKKMEQIRYEGISMNEYGWHFKQQPAGYRDRNPKQNSEFFSSEAVGSMVSALVREGLQNSGDARSTYTPDDQPVRVRIFLSNDETDVTPESMSPWTRGLFDHLEAPDSGLHNVPRRDEPCRFLVFEDFGTTGLCGDTVSDDVSNEPFYCFFRAENATSKESESGGSWGIGKATFPHASRGWTFFALSTRETDGRTVLMGSVVLNTHHVEGKKFVPDAWFGAPQVGTSDGGVIQPIEDIEAIEHFRTAFHLARPATGENGTSVVIPWCNASLTTDAIVRAVVQSNFLPIINGTLVVSVGSTPNPEEDILLDTESIEDIVEGLGDDDKKEKAAMLVSVRLAKWSCLEGATARVAANHIPPERKQSVKWGQYDLGEHRESLREQFDIGRPIALRVPVPLARTGGDDRVRTSYLDVYIQRTPDTSTVRPIFVRDSVVIPDPDIKRVSGAVAIIRSFSDELSDLLRAAEDPGHKEWSKETDNFCAMKDKFTYAGTYLKFARNAAQSCHRLLQEPDAEEDFDLLGDVFSLPKPSAEKELKPGQRGKKRKKKGPVIKIDKRPQMITVSPIRDGFTITTAGHDAPTPKRIRIRAAYNVRRGNPFNAWNAADFSFDKSEEMIRRIEGLTVEECSGNVLSLIVNNPAFSLSVNGFDTARGDLKIDVRPEGEFDATDA